MLYGAKQAISAKLEHGLSFVLNLNATCSNGTHRRHSWPRGVHGIISSLALAKKCQILRGYTRLEKHKYCLPETAPHLTMVMYGIAAQSH